MSSTTKVHSRKMGRGWQWLHWAVTLAIVCPMFLIPQAASAQAGPRPGDDNPAVVYSEWRDDEFFSALPVLADNNQSRLGIFAPNSAMTSTVMVDHQDFAANVLPDATAAAGRILSPRHEIIVYAHRSGSGVGVSFFRPTTAQPVALLPDLAARLGTSSDFLKIAAGDLDGMPADDTEYRDEVVVAYAQPGAGNRLPVSVAVLDFAGAGESAPAPTAVTTAASSAVLDGASIASGAILHGDGGLDCAVGDYDGDGAKEIMVAYLSGTASITVDVFRYAVTQTGNTVQRSLTRAGSSVISIPPISLVSAYLHATLALVMADFDGDNLAEAALATAVSSYQAPPTDDFVQMPLLYTLEITGASPAVVRPAHSAYMWGYQDVNRSFYGAVQLAPGLFKVDPAHGWDLNRRQLVMAYYGPASYNGITTGIWMQAFTIGSDLTIGASSSAMARFSVSGSTARFALAAGGYAGATSTDNPYWVADLAIWDQKAISHNYLQVRENSIVIAGTPLTWTAKANPAYGGRLALAPVDTDGDTVYLGAPVHIVVENLVSTDFILEEPPKHAYWDPGLKTVTNVSRVDGFNISLVKSDKTEFSTTSKDTTDWSIGSSVSASASETVGANVNGGIAKESMEASIQATAKVGYDYQEHESDYTSSYADRTVSFTGVTSRDDYIVGKLQTLDVWRYRMFGMQAGDPQQYTYYEIVMPGPYQDLATSAGGLSFDWYQPLHENGNILSYPQFDSSTFTPADLGVFTLPGSDAPVRQLLLDPSQRAWDATSDSISLNFSTASGGGSERSYSHTLSENASVKATFKSSSSFGGPKNNVSSTFTASGEVELHNKNSWGSAETSSNKTTSSTGITLNKATGSAETAYFFYPAMYVTSDGTIKVTYAVDPLSHPSGGAWWAEQYGRQPDLALNLPLRFTTTSNEYGVVKWTPTKSIVRKQMRGFFVRKAELNAVTGEYDLITSAVPGGAAVRLEARVYNYSLGQSVPTGAVVRFEAAPYDPNTNQEGVRFPIATTTLPLLEPRKVVTASVVWDTSTITWDAGGEKHYRIYVVLDPDNQVPNEKYETESAASQRFCYSVSDAQPQVCIDPGQNNEGYGYVTVKRQLLGDPNWQKPSADVSMATDGLAALDPDGNLATGAVQADFGQPLQLRVTVHSDAPSTDFSTVLIYDGDPARGGVLIAGKKVFAGSLEEDGSSVWFEWTPESGGPHILYARLLQSIHDPVATNNVSQLQVNVQGWAVTDLLYMPVIARQ